MRTIVGSLVSFFALFVLPFPLAAEDRVIHYKVAHPETVTAAKRQFSSAKEDIRRILNHETLSPLQLERIHEISYSLEAALPSLLNAEGPAPKSEHLAVAVEELHLASERHDEGRTRAAYQRIESLSVEVLGK